MERLAKIKEYLESCKKATELAAKVVSMPSEFRSVTEKILDIQEAVNEEIFFTKYFSTTCYAKDEIETAIASGTDFVESVKVWIELAWEIINLINNSKNVLDAEFYSLMNYFSISTREGIVSDMKRNVLLWDKQRRQITSSYYNSLYFLWGRLDIEKGEVELLENRAKSIKEHEADFLWLYERLGDYRSKNILYRTIRNWLTFFPGELMRMEETAFEEYSDLDIIDETDNGIFVDCGAFDGDSTDRFIRTYRRYKRIYCYEASPENFKKLSENLSGYENIVLYRKAVGDCHTTMTISDDKDGSSLIKGGKDEVKVVPLDDDIKEPISIVKMDIEGAEQDALRGMKKHIENDRPKLIICVYHGNRDIVEIPRLIDSMRNDYRFYLRNKGTHMVDVPVDTVLYAV